MSIEEQFLFSQGITSYNLLSSEKLNKSFFAPRERFAHKGNFGHSLLIAGSYGKAGAAILATKACLRVGCGLISVHIPKKLYSILQVSVPEAMVLLDKNEEIFSSNEDLEKYNAIAIGPGLDTKPESLIALESLLKKNTKPIVIDADGLNLLARIPNFIELLNNNTILTPHPKEFERLFGKMAYNEKINLMKNLSKERGVNILLKGGVSAIACNNGEIFYNVIGNPGMATAGSGDVLTGIILGILSQGFSTSDSLKLGVYLHALSGDLAKEELGEKSIIATDLINYLPKAICKL